MKALYITIKPIYPTIDGGCVAMASFLNHLLTIYEKVDHLTIETHKHPFSIENYPLTQESKLTIEAIHINTKISIVDAFLNLFSSKSYNVIRFYSKTFEQKLIQLLQSKHSVIYLESIFLLPYLKTIRANSNAKVILRAPNIEHQIWFKHAENEVNPLKKWYLKLLASKLKKFEIKQYHLVDGILTITNNDAAEIESFGVKTPLLYLPYSLKSEELSPIKNSDFFFIGAYNWQPNLDAVLYLIKTLFPLIKEKYPTAKLHIAGSYTPDFLYTFQSDSISIHGKVESVKEFMKNHGILLAPISSGSGVRIKILEALSFGIPVIGSKIAIQGIQSKACFVAETDNDYLKIIEEINKHNIHEIQKEAIDYINKNYNKNKIEETLNDFIKTC